MASAAIMAAVQAATREKEDDEFAGMSGACACVCECSMERDGHVVNTQTSDAFRVGGRRLPLRPCAQLSRSHSPRHCYGCHAPPRVALRGLQS